MTTTRKGPRLKTVESASGRDVGRTLSLYLQGYCTFGLLFCPVCAGVCAVGLVGSAFMLLLFFC